ncbi:MAG: hypothetical protein ABIZ70_05385 [Gemmatimonadales bacterium]
MKRIRIGVALAGMLLAVVALWRDDRRVTWIAIGVLALAVLLRVVARRSVAADE